MAKQTKSANAVNNNPYGILTAITARNMEFRTEKISPISKTVPDQTKKMSRLAELAKRGMPIGDTTGGLQPLFLGEQEAAHFNMLDAVQQAEFVKQQRKAYRAAYEATEKKMLKIKAENERKKIEQMIEEGIKLRAKTDDVKKADQKPA